MNRTISDIKQATLFLGLERINNLIASEALKRSFNGESSISLERFWDEATDIANAMVFIAENVDKTDHEGHIIKEVIPLEDLYTLGLFHDCGIPAIALKHKNYIDILSSANEANQSSIVLEDQHYNTNHSIVGYLISTSWFIPENICELVLRHHDRTFFEDGRVTHQSRIMMAVLKAAEQLVYLESRNRSCPEWDEFHTETLNTLNLVDDEFDELYERYLGFIN